ncbi:MAG: ribosome small subunit-dependent GTPase A [Flavobacteriales bacterium]|nr:ribosome small subunit-dependent GTPase A [Flavobacteriales bacterium]
MTKLLKHKATVYKTTGSWYVLKTEDGLFLDARIRGKFKLQGIRTTNPLSVGDYVIYELENETTAWITEILPRENYLIRTSVNLSKETHIIASNLDLAVIIFTLKYPETSLGFLDRFLINCEAYQIKPFIILNKWDLYSEQEKEKAKELIQIYTNIGYNIIYSSFEKEHNLDNIQQNLIEKKSLIFGHSGAGKSTLINKLLPNNSIKTSEVSNFNQKGKHTTTFAQMYDLPSSGAIIDTPGIKEFGIVDFQKNELQSYFPEIFKHSENCKFNNCIHINEPKCKVLHAVENNEISAQRYKSYLTLLEECKK